MDESHPTEYQELNHILGVFTTRLKENLGDDLVGAYLQGSFATGDYDLHSDVDFAVVVKEALTDGKVAALQNMHGRIFNLDSPWAHRLDGSYFPRKILLSQDSLNEELWYLDNGHRSMVKSTHCNTLVVRWVLHERGVTLSGPPPGTLVAPVSSDKLREEIYQVMTDWGDEILGNPDRFNNRFYQSFIVLSYCRMLYSLYTGRVESKQAGAEFAKTNLDPQWFGLIDRTWAGRPNPSLSVRQPAEKRDFADTLEFIQTINAERERVMSG